MSLVGEEHNLKAQGLTTLQNLRPGTSTFEITVVQVKYRGYPTDSSIFPGKIYIFYAFFGDKTSRHQEISIDLSW